jgi:hypothetical protein
VTGTSPHSEDTAKADALRLADEEARVTCGPADGKVIRNMTASYQDPRWDCVRIGGYRCTLDGKAICRYQQKLRAPACECER